MASERPMVTLKIPAPSSMLVINLLGLFGLVGLAVAVGGLTHNWYWSLAVGALEAIVLSVIAATHVAAAEQSAASSPASLKAA
jgi:hypothetical protein